MKLIALLAIILAVTATAQGKQKGGQKGGGTTNTDTTDDTTDSTTTTTTTTTTDASYADIVKALIEAGTCDTDVSTTSNCGSDATGYYETFEYNGERVIIVSGAPDHEAEYDQVKVNPNTRCERWQYVVVPLSPENTGFTDTGLGATGYATSGGVFYNHLSSPFGDLAWYNEIDSLDPCMGHSDDSNQYHYHGVPYCIPEDTFAANDPTICQFVGYMLDGFPIYGTCLHTDGTELQSCYSCDSDVCATEDDYSYNNDASCNLDKSNGYTFTAAQTSDGYAGYAYVTTREYPGVPIYYAGTKETACGFTP